MTATAIRNVALKYLAAYDYDAFSMNQIANEVGIKKASIYAHYRSKEEIFYAVLTEALHDGKQKIVRFFLEQRDQPLDETLHAFFRWFVKESEDHLQLKFLLRMLYFPPSHLKSYESSQYTGACSSHLKNYWRDIFARRSEPITSGFCKVKQTFQLPF
ncbi:transcriptional regulator, TetR family [Geomicrobium sp. JCM 19037]|uniref:TetR/AcrR family transcriptional regulator n=1 Tax=Geomicrobium sp. JCM 19037 TaxID=1460634 RepID=UPI00045F15E5|nr:TetR/AcrR family transcriptional regulator [Geomicrobium sp. JCM 19037]GAK04335.1 transcriptional regulator, TetR family [Geomicrobium sp. JCM 19037]